MFTASVLKTWPYKFSTHHQMAHFKSAHLDGSDLTPDKLDELVSVKKKIPDHLDLNFLRATNQ